MSYLRRGDVALYFILALSAVPAAIVGRMAKHAGYDQAYVCIPLILISYCVSFLIAFFLVIALGRLERR